MKRIIESTPNLEVFQAVVTGIIVDNGSIKGVNTNLGADFYAQGVSLQPEAFCAA